MTGGKMSQDRERTKEEDEEEDGERKTMTSDRGRNQEGRNYTSNEYLKSLKSDHLYHLALDTSTHDFCEMFGDVKFVCVGGTLKRMESFAYFVGQELGIKLPTGVTLKDITQNAHRYSMFKIGPVLSVTHGMGAPSLSILLHELLKLITYARCTDVVFLRIGTSGGIGVEPGSIVITNKAIDGFHREYHEQAILGKLVQRPANFDPKIVSQLLSIGKTCFSDRFKTYQGTTMCTSDFYEGQGRLDGAFCSYTPGEKMEYLESLRSIGVKNIEMESTTFGAMCTAAKVPGGIICCTLLDRIVGDQVLLNPSDYEEFQRRPQQLAAEFIKRRLETRKFIH